MVCQSKSNFAMTDEVVGIQRRSYENIIISVVNFGCFKF